MKKITILYPADPMGVIPSGIDTFIRGVLRWAPADLQLSLIGVTTDRVERPLGQWVECDLGRSKYQFFAVAALDSPEKRGRIPLVIRFMLGLLYYRPVIDADIIEFHRIEPSLLYYFDSRPKNAFFHQDMQILLNSHSDILWSRLPGLYFWFQDRLIRRLANIYIVRRNGVEFCKKRYPDIDNRITFVPTWFDPDIFHPVDALTKQQRRRRLGIAAHDELLVTVGRLDTQKKPLMLARSFKQILAKRPKAKLWYIGDGVLRNELEDFLFQEGIAHRVTLKGLKSAEYIASILTVANVFVLSSAYEGMPMCVLEALGSGIPVVTTNVGEVKLVVINGVSGEVIEEQNDELLCNAVVKVLTNPELYRSEAIVKAASAYIPAKVLNPIYDKYRELSSK